MRDLTATEASRRFSEILDWVEHDGESFVIRRHGRAVARLEPVARPNGGDVLEFLRKHRPDRDFARDVMSVRELLTTEERVWPD